MQFLPHFPIHVNPIALFGLTLIFGLIGGELARRSRILPIISGYIIVGYLVGPSGFNIVTPSLLDNARIFVDVSLGLILFDLGRHLDFIWLRHDKGLLPMAVTESSLTLILVFIVLLLFQLPVLSAAVGATIAVATSPAVAMLIAHDLSSEGPVTRRTLALTSFNNLYGVILFTLLLPLSLTHNSYLNLILDALYRLLGSFGLGCLLFLLTKNIAQLIGKRKENQFVLFTGMVIFSIGLATILNLSTMLTLFTLGIGARNFDKQHVLTEVDFGWLARLFFILLFVITGVQLKLIGLWQFTLAVVSFLLTRFLAKSCGIWLFAKASRLTRQQAYALCLTLLPMAEIGIGMTNKITNLHPELGNLLIIIITAAVAILDIIGPITTQFAFISTGETVQENYLAGAIR